MAGHRGIWGSRWLLWQEQVSMTLITWISQVLGMQLDSQNACCGYSNISGQGLEVLLGHVGLGFRLHSQGPVESPGPDELESRPLS